MFENCSNFDDDRHSQVKVYVWIILYELIYGYKHL